MLTFAEGESILSSGKPKLDHNTVLHRLDADRLAVRFYVTDIVIIHRDGTYTLYSGGYATSPTTRGRIATYSPVAVHQETKKGVKTHFVWNPLTQHDYPFSEGMRVDSDGNPVGGITHD